MTEQEKVLAGGGDMGARMRAKDWSQTPLGPVEGWPPALRTAVSVMLASPYPIVIYWGEELVQLHNDSLAPLIGDKHPGALGVPVQRAYAELWEVLRGLFDRVMRAQTAVYLENQLLAMNRQGFLEEAYFTFSYIPIRDEHSQVVGVFTIASEATRQVLGERRVKILRELSIRTALAQDARGVLLGAREVLAQCGPDVPFALLYRVEGEQARLTLRMGLEEGARLAPGELGLGEASCPWPLNEVLRSGEERLVEGLGALGDALHAGPWPEPVGRALLLPLSLGGGSEPDAVLVVGLSPRLPLDEAYRDFLQLLSRQLAADVARARALEQEKRRAEQLAELDRSKTDFFSNVSHEFRTPLTLMLGPLEDTLTDASGTLPAEHRERLMLVQRNTTRLFKLVNSLLDFSRLEAGRAQISFQPTDLAALTTELSSHFESAAQRAGLVLTVDAPPLAQPVWVDPEAWEKMVFNLLSNALKHTFAGGITVSLREEEGQAVLRVRDTGTGVPASALPRLFERFHRVEGARARSHEGSGIGLALVRELTRLHGGEASVHSVLGEGSTFRLQVPLGHAHLPPERLVPDTRTVRRSGDARAWVEEAHGWMSGPHAPAPSAAEGSRPRVLVVDDNTDMRTYVTSVLASSFEVEAVADGQLALESARARPPDLILSDVMMPRLGGFGLLRAVRSSPGLQEVPFLLLSARAGEEASVEGLESGADDYLVKPFSARELLARVRAHLERVHARREATALEARESGLREAVHARDDFLSVASHELKTPLTALRLQLEAHERMLPAEVRAGSAERLHAMHRQTRRLAGLVEEMLDVSLIATGRLQLRLERTDLAGLVTDSAAQAREELARHGCGLGLEVAPGLHGDFDAARVGQLVRNLLSNAMRFGPGQPVQVRLGRRGPRAVLEVVDHGIGVRPEQRERIFERFGRAESARQYGGLGLGLWVSRQVVEAHGGTLAVRDTPGGGATFTVELPLALAD